MKGRSIPYSDAEMAWLEANRLLPISDYAAGFCAIFGRHDVTAAHLHALRKRKGWKTGRTGCFAKGQEPTNKGKPCPPGVGGRHPNARRTQFTAGERRGVAVKLYKPIGTERLSKEGYRQRKIHDGMPLQSRWRAVHLIEWEAVNGPVPKGHCLKCLDGDVLNTTPANWKLIPRAMLPALAGGNRYRKRLAYDDAASELKPTLLAMAEVEHRARSLRRPAAGGRMTPDTPTPAGSAISQEERDAMFDSDTSEHTGGKSYYRPRQNTGNHPDPLAETFLVTAAQLAQLTTSAADASNAAGSDSRKREKDAWAIFDGVIAAIKAEPAGSASMRAAQLSGSGWRPSNPPCQQAQRVSE